MTVAGVRMPGDDPSPAAGSVIGVVGFVGLGRMGMPMVRRLAAADFEVRAFDTASAARAEVAEIDGVTAVPEVAAAARDADALVLMVPDSDAVESVLSSPGVIDELRGRVVVDMSSSVPARTRRLAERLADHDIELVDAPVSGGVRGARSGTLTIMVGGREETRCRLLPMLSAVGATILAAGPTGAGHAVKALNNLMSAAHLLVSSEVMLAAKAFGLDQQVVLDIVNTSSGRSGSTLVKWPDYILPGTFDSGFGLQLMLKDMRIALDLIESTGGIAPGSRPAVQAWADAAATLPADADHTEIARWLELAGRRPVDAGPSHRGDLAP